MRALIAWARRIFTRRRHAGLGERLVAVHVAAITPAPPGRKRRWKRI